MVTAVCMSMLRVTKYPVLQPFSAKPKTLLILLSGKNASYKPVITLTTCVGVGYDVSGSAGLSLHYKGQGDLLRTDFETTRGKYFIDQGLKTSIGGSIFGKATLSHTYAPLGPNNYMNSYGLGLGLSVTPGLNGGTGVPTTIILYGRD